MLETSLGLSLRGLGVGRCGERRPTRSDRRTWTPPPLFFSVPEPLTSANETAAKDHYPT